MTARILVVDDILPNIKLLEAKLSAEYFDVLTASDGESAVQIVKAEMPDLILLDLSMPRKNGFEVLEEVKADPSLKRIPVVVLTSSSAQSDVLGSYERHANTYVTKPNTLDEFSAAIRQIEEFWFSTARLPAE